MRNNRRDFLSSMTGLVAAALIPSLAVSATRRDKATAGLRGAFEHPISDARPWVRWWWPGGIVTTEELHREIKVMREAGFGGAEIQPFKTMLPRLTEAESARLHDYANPAFFSHLRSCAEEAVRQGLQVDYTFGSAWPSGGGWAITPELALLELTPYVNTVKAPLSEPIRIKAPTITKKLGAMSSLEPRNKDPRAHDWRARLDARQKLVAVVAFKGRAPVLSNNKNFRSAKVVTSGTMDSSTGVVLTDKLGVDGVLDWTPPSDGDWQVVVFKQFVADSSVMTGVGEGPQLVLDHFKRAAFAAHAQRVGDPVASNGEHLPGMRATFIDSLELMPDLYWSEDLLAQFAIRRGYDLTSYLPHLLQPGWMEAWNAHLSPPYFDVGDVGGRIRADYRLTLSELMIENFWQPYVDWNHLHGIKARAQPHGGPSDLLRSYGMLDIPEAEDLENGGGNIHFIRMARAAANLYGRTLVSCESLCWPEKPYEITPSQWLARVNLLFASGVNSLVMHGMPYVLHQEKWPGWYPFAANPVIKGFSSMLSESNPLWHALPTLNEYITRIQSVLQRGRNVVPLCVYYGEMGYYHGIEGEGFDIWLDNLLAGGYDHDRINDDSILNGKMVGGRLVTSGGISYAALIVPSRDGLRLATARKLAIFGNAGLPIFYLDRPPFHEQGYSDPEHSDQQVRLAVQETLRSGARIVPATTAVASLRAEGVRPNLTFTGASCLFIEKELDGQTVYFFHNRSEQDARVQFVTGAAGHPERWHAIDGNRESLPAQRSAKGTDVSFDLAAGAATMIAFTAARPEFVPTYLNVQKLDLNQRSWSLKVDGYGREGRIVQEQISLSQLKDWSEIQGLVDFSGTGEYETNVAVDISWLAQHRQVWLELGKVHDMAAVSINGQLAATLIAAPFRLDITRLLRTGTNSLSVKVSNSPNNAMVNPKLPHLKHLAQQPAGVLGPIQLVLKEVKK